MPIETSPPCVYSKEIDSTGGTSMSTSLPSRCAPIGPAAIAIAESVSCCSNLSAAAASSRTKVTAGVTPLPALTSSSAPSPSAFFSAGPTAPVSGSLTVIATSPLARSWRTYSTPPSSLTLTKRMSTLPLSDTLALCSETTQAESGGSCGQETPAIWQTISCARLRISSPTGVTDDGEDDRGDDQQRADVLGRGLTPARTLMRTTTIALRAAIAHEAARLTLARDRS